MMKMNAQMYFSGDNGPRQREGIGTLSVVLVYRLEQKLSRMKSVRHFSSYFNGHLLFSWMISDETEKKTSENIRLRRRHKDLEGKNRKCRADAGKSI